MVRMILVVVWRLGLTFGGIDGSEGQCSGIDEDDGAQAQGDQDGGD